MSDQSADYDAPRVERRMTEYGFIYDGSPEWSSHAYAKWPQEVAERERENAILWRVPERVGVLICRERVSYADSVGDWTTVIASADPASQEES